MNRSTSIELTVPASEVAVFLWLLEAESHLGLASVAVREEGISRMVFRFESARRSEVELFFQELQQFGLGIKFETGGSGGEPPVSRVL